MASIRRLGPRSTLLNHSFPSFYACYLLKSVQTPQSTAIYIGSTPSPPRRIRQHNGELTQGAKRTRSKRPWVMQMIVHGFPSRLAALQFEWAWQHPHKSRHLRDATGGFFGNRASKLLKKNVLIVRAMISRHPFNTWPLHVKIFTEEVANIWKTADADPTLVLPLGFTYTIELEGVDGQSGHPGSGRRGPISVDDADFTSAIMAKTTEILASGRPLNCSICHKPVEGFSTDQVLKSALCPSANCRAVSHLECLSRHFQGEKSEDDIIVPRGGNCKSCGEYTLWGDIIRGCYRRMPPIDENGQQLLEGCSDDMYVSDDDKSDLGETPKVKGKKRSTSASKRTRKSAKAKGKGKATASQSSEGESFDFGNITSSSSENESATPMKRSPGRPRKNVLTPMTSLPVKKPISPTRSNKTKGKNKEKATETTLANGGIYTISDIDIASRSDGGTSLPVKRRPGSPRNSPTLSSPVKKSTIPFTGTTQKTAAVPALKSCALTPRKETKQRAARTASGSGSASSSEGEFFDFDNIASSSESVGPPSPLKAKVGRPRKVVGSPTPGISFPTPSSNKKSSKKTTTIGISAGPAATPRRGEVIDLTLTTSSSGSGSSAGKRKQRQPRKVSPSVISITSNSDKGGSVEKKTRGRPRQNIASSSSRGSSAGKKARGRPRKDIQSAKGVVSSSTIGSSVEKKTRGQLVTSPGMSSKRQYHHSTMSGYLGPNLIQSRIMSDINRQPVENPSPTPSSSKSRIPRSPNSGHLDDLQQAMSSLTVSTPTRTLSKNIRPQKENVEVIVLSD